MSNFEPKSSRLTKFLLVINGLGCGMLLCCMLSISGLFFNEPTDNISSEEPATAVLEIATATPIATLSLADGSKSPPSPPPIVTTKTNTPTAQKPTVVPTKNQPEFSKITFAYNATADGYRPISPTLTFTEGITEVHAIFDYTGMSKDYVWERKWYRNDQQILKTSASWSGDEIGRFDYFVDAGGAPLPSGNWKLELYVEGNLLVTGTFTINAMPEIALGPTTAPTNSLPIMPLATTPSSASTPLVAKDKKNPTATRSAVATGVISPPDSKIYKLVYTKWDGAKHDMYVADTNGKNEKFLLHRSAGPSWTADGQQIFFYGEEGIDRQLLPNNSEFIFDGISNGIVALTNAASLPKIEDAKLYQALTWKQGSARWANVSPDGQMVAFDASFSGNPRIYFLGTSNSQQFRYEIIGEQADWSPNSQKLVYRSGRGGVTGLWISNRDDSGHALLTQEGSDSLPSWSPDGSTIAFSRDANSNVDIYTINIDGTSLRRLTNSPGPDTLPVYASNGDIIFRSARTGSWGIWKMSGNGNNPTQIITNAPVGPDWTKSRMDVR